MTNPNEMLAKIADDLDSFVHDMREDGNDASALWLEQRVTSLRRLAATSTGTAGVDREAVARIIEPLWMERYEACRDTGQLAENGKLWADVAYGAERDRAFAKADAVLSLLRTAAPVEDAKGDPVTQRIGAWLSAALEDPNVCAEMKADITAWFAAGEPTPSQSGEAEKMREACAADVERRNWPTVGDARRIAAAIRALPLPSDDAAAPPRDIR